MSKNFSSLIFLPFLSVFRFANTVVALPENGNVTAGNVSINQVNQNQLNIDQSSDRAIIDWNSFNIWTSPIHLY